MLNSTISLYGAGVNNAWQFIPKKLPCVVQASEVVYDVREEKMPKGSKSVPAGGCIVL